MEGKCKCVREICGAQIATNNTNRRHIVLGKTEALVHRQMQNTSIYLSPVVLIVLLLYQVYGTA